MLTSDKRKIRVLLAGNPNVGKSTLFNALTGLRQHTGNWPGKTVSVAVGVAEREDIVYEFTDLPGTYSLSGSSPDERVAADAIRAADGTCIVAVCDGSCLERTLILALQILACSSRVVVCINLMDEARNRGFRIDATALSAALGVPVILTAAGRGEGLEELLCAIHATSELPPIGKTNWPDPVQAAEEITSQCVSRVHPEENWRLVLDRLLVSRRHGIPILLSLLMLITFLTVVGANYPSRMLEGLFEWGYGVLSGLLAALPSWLRGPLLDGIYRTCSAVISVMLPPMMIFFPLFTLLEDVGYLPRMAFLLDRPMCRCGGCGKQALTLCMGLGCNAVGVTGCRIIDSPRERLAGILTNAMVPCNGRFPSLILLGSIFFSGAGSAFIVAGCIVLGVLVAMASSGILSKTALRHEESTFLMEMPPLRRPCLGKILVRSLLDRSLAIALRTLKVAAPAGAILWLFGNLGVWTELSRWLDPVGLALGMNGVILLGFLFSLPANELLLPVILMILTNSGSLSGTASAGSLLMAAGWTWKTALCTMVFILFHWPCATTLMTIHAETGSKAKTAAAALLPTAVGCTLCMMLQLLLRELGG